MEKVCIIFLMLLITMTLWTNDIRITIADVLISIFLFIILYTIFFYVGKYIKVRRERKDFEMIMNSLKECIERQNIQ